MFGKIHEGTITIFYGKMGSGKTTNAMAQVLDFHRRGLPVWVNFPIVRLPVSSSTAPIWYEEDPEGILSMRGGLYVIDEAYLKLNSRKWATLPEAVFLAFTHCRKLDMTIIVIAQSWMRIDKSIREISSLAREFRGSKFFGRMYDYVEYEIDEMGEIIKQEPVEFRAAKPGFSLIRKSVYDAFDTDYLFSKAPVEKLWKTALKAPGGEGAAGGGATVQSAPLRFAPPPPASLEKGRLPLSARLRGFFGRYSKRSPPSPAPDVSRADRRSGAP